MNRLCADRREGGNEKMRTHQGAKFGRRRFAQLGGAARYLKRHITERGT